MSETTYLLTETQIRRNISADEILRYLKTRRTTGVVTFNLVEGGVRSITIGERTKPTREPSEIYSVLGAGAENNSAT